MTTPRRRKVWQHDTENISEDQISEYFHRLGWVVERFGKDYGEDLFIRIFEEGAFTGKAFYVQLKGTNNIQQYALKIGVFSYVVDVVNLLQWHRNEFPVIFVLWDIEQRVGYWLHIQSYVDKKLKKDPLWLKQEEGKRSIHIPFDQMIPWDGDNTLLAVINAEQPLWQMLAEVNQKLDMVDPHYRLEARLTRTGTEVTTVEKYPGAAAEKPIKIKFTTSIPTKTDKGRELAERIEQFITSGVPVKVPLSYVKNLELPEFIKQALAEITEDGFLIMGPAHNPKPLVIRIEITNNGGEQFTLEQVHLKVAQAGREEVTLTNDEQPMPIKVRLVQPRRNKSERYGSLWKGEREEGEHEHAPSKRDPLESQFGAARGTATPSAPLHESPTAGASWEDHSGSSSRSQQYEDHPGPAGGS